MPWTKRQILAAAAIALVALIVRIAYVHTAVVDHPLRGDTLQYFAYALNLIDHHVFSLVPPGAVPTPDSFRDPGYPVFLALLIKGFGRHQAFYSATLDVQAGLAALTVLIYIVLARRWLGMGIALFVGIGLALWPHAITLAGYVLSETLMGFLVAAGLLLTQAATDRRRPVLFAIAGIVLGLATLTNATFAPVVLLFAGVAMWKDLPSRRSWAVLLVASLLPVAAWGVRGAMLPPGQSAGDRIAINLIQGSWPEYHDAWRSSLERGDAKSISTIQRMDAEYQLVKRDLPQGLDALAQRMRSEPWRYMSWYAGKPVELWGWSIGVGMGDIYVFPTYNSPLSGNGILRVTTDIMFFASPLVLGLATVGLIILLTRRRAWPPALWLGALAVCVITAIFTALQCDARYAVPYRGIEWMLAGVALHTLVTLRRRAVTHP
ncbi:hypothetical protein FIV34_06080 [Luteibacter pinisoli]|uniref:Glycosyltransferase RgtA/B/C/D-like domain-containing protein n=1 Tax=Luteibacter pinisoli TaxID=2589080 RepID=A0A4Y5Z2G6_9GAMM|nr:glycosyltransferase family 39 protein [Luteibacter pinisoli]QDE38799.1 hypothetical protein FIV34_06080 [Luteibacter pinisoli]